MNFRTAGLYTNRSTVELKTEFEDIIEAMDAIGFTKDITIEMLEFWLYGSVPRNYYAYMGLLNVEELLRKAGVPTQHISNTVSENAPIDKYLLFKNACLNFIGEDLTKDFKSLVVDPFLKMYVEPSVKDNKERLEALAEARATITKLNTNISKTIASLQKMKPYHISGTDVESVLIKLEQISLAVDGMDD